MWPAPSGGPSGSDSLPASQAVDLLVGDPAGTPVCGIYLLYHIGSFGVYGAPVGHLLPVCLPHRAPVQPADSVGGGYPVWRGGVDRHAGHVSSRTGRSACPAHCAPGALPQLGRGRHVQSYLLRRHHQQRLLPRLVGAGVPHFDPYPHPAGQETVDHPHLLRCGHPVPGHAPERVELLVGERGGHRVERRPGAERAGAQRTLFVSGGLWRGQL